MKLSIVTPSYNQGAYIEKTIQSVLSQQVDHLQYIVMDGASTDNTVSILQRYQDQLTYISEPDQGQADAVNKALKLVDGDIIGWLNSDDVYYPDAFKKIMNFFAKHPHIDVLYGDAFHIDQNDAVIEKYPTESWNLKRLKKTCYISQPTVFFRRSVLDKYGYLDASLHFCLDYDYWLRLALKGAKFAYLPEVIAGSRLYPATKTMSSPLKAQLEALGMLRKNLQQVPDEWLVTYAFTYVKTKTHHRFPHVKFILSAWLSVCYLTFQWNGIWRGVQSFFSLPVTILKMKLKN